MTITPTPTRAGRRRAPAADPVRQYLDEIGRRELLTPAEEADLAKRVGAGSAARERLAVIGADDPRRPVLEQIAQEGTRARERFIGANLRLVVAMAKRYVRSDLELLDLVQSGNIGLMQAVDRFDPSRGYRFSTYASWWIRQHLQRVMAGRGTIRLPIRLRDLEVQAHEALNRLAQRLGREPSPEELAHELDIDAEALEVLEQVGRPPLSLDRPVTPETPVLMMDLIPDLATLEPESEAVWRALPEMMRDALASLSPEEQLAIAIRYRLPLGEGELVPEDVPFTRGVARRLQRDALEKLRRPEVLAALSGAGPPPPSEASRPATSRRRPRRSARGPRPPQLPAIELAVPPPPEPTGTPRIVPLASGEGRRWRRVGAITTVGRSPANSLVLADPRVSRAHALLHRAGRAVVLWDLGSLNGTAVNREPVAGLRRLHHGDVVTFGPIACRYLE